MLSDVERYLFDLNGYLVVKRALAPEALARILASSDQAVSDENRHGIRNTTMFAAPLERASVFRDLIDNPRIIPYLRELVGAATWNEMQAAATARDAIRLDFAYFIFQSPGHPGADLHLGGTPYCPPASYHVRNGDIASALTVVAYILTEVPPGGGGFACIPGSHKANFSLPETSDSFDPFQHVVSPGVEPGDAILFTEALTHGTLPWNAAHARRVLFYKYCPSHMAWFHPRWPQRLLKLCTAEQRAMLESPYVADLPEMFSTDIAAFGPGYKASPDR